ncbi:MAG: Fmu (Sun) domain-containing protein [Ferruginibacter sp.]
MSRFHSHIASATKIIQAYNSGKPLSMHIRSFLAADKKYGSKDRRGIASLCYYYFRTGKAFTKNTIEEKILNSLFLCEQQPQPILELLQPELNAKVALPIDEKLTFTGASLHEIFPYESQLSDVIDQDLFSLSFLKQPDIFLRIRPGNKRTVVEKLEKASIKFELIGTGSVRLPNNVAVDKILQLNKVAVVQDINSQKVLDYLDGSDLLSKSISIKAWDCCAASGGKSILLFDKLKGNVQVTVSDIRENILLNLKTRLLQAHVPVADSFIADLSKQISGRSEDKFSIIICDAPCTGSGTWSRTPEQMYFFNHRTISEYAERQQKIVSNSVPLLENGGLYFYITCSVFSKENEDIVEYMQQQLPVKLLKAAYLKGYEHAADTMFVAVFTSL